MSKRLVYAEDAIDALIDNFGYINPMAFVEILSDLPPAQPEIVRCKDCKYWSKDELCEKWNHYGGNEDFYCGCAERRTE